MIACDLEIDVGNCVEIIAEFVEALARESRLPRQQAYWLRLATEEIVTNAAQHGYHGDGPVWLRSGVGQDRVWIQIEDAAPEFDPRTHDPGPQPMSKLSEGEAGGYGLLLATRGAAELHYERVNDRNRSTISVSRLGDA